MKYTIVILSLACITGVFSSCQNNTDNSSGNTGNEMMWGEYIIEVFDGDTIASLKGNAIPVLKKGLVKNNKKQGFWTEFHDRDPVRIKSLTMYKDGIMNGPYYEFNINGMPLKQLTYLNGVLNGDYHIYKNNVILESAYMKNGKYDGIRKLYFPTFDNRGKIQQLITYKNGIQEGVLQWFNKDGEVIQEFMYENGEKVR